MKVLITGGCGFIGSHVVRFFVNNYPDYCIFNLDNLTYAGNLENLADIKDYSNYKFIKGDITEKKFISNLFDKYKFDIVINLAAESHVDKSIISSSSFINTNVIGTVNLLDSFKKTWFENYNGKLFLHVSTDEVFGSLGESGFFTERSPYMPSSPYSASKASSDHFVRAYGKTFGVPFIITNCSNNYGPFQFPEKLIPLFINNIIKSKSLPIYGNGNQIRDWLFVDDHVNAIDTLFHCNKRFESFNIGGSNEIKNIDLINLLCHKMSIKLNKPKDQIQKLIKFVDDRPGHDYRYAINSKKINQEFGWKPKTSIEKGLSITVDWYLDNQKWLSNVESKEYLNYYSKQYNL